MPIITYNKRYLLEKLGFKIDTNELVRNINNMGLDVESVSEDEIVIEVKADRPDLLNSIGMARALRYFMRRSRKFGYKLRGEATDFTVNVGSHVSKIRPYISCLVVRNITFSDDDLRDMINFIEKLSETYGRKRRRMAIGLHDLRDVKPPIRYDAYDDEEFVPLNRSGKMRYSEVLKKEEKGMAYGDLLGETGRKYVALKDSQGTMALIPIINSDRTKVTASTKSMLVDITGDTKYIIEKVADVLAVNFIDMGYDVCCVRVKYGSKAYSFPRMECRTISLPLEQINKEIGVNIGFNNAILLANKMGYEAALIGKKIRVKVPEYRLDIINEQDVIEDLAIAYGYDYIQPIVVPAITPGRLENKSRVMKAISEAMAGLGFSEMLNSYLTNESTNFEFMKSKGQHTYVRLANPKSGMITMLRTWLLPSLLKNLSQSMHDRLPQKIFEMDMAFKLEDAKPVEDYHLAAVTCDTRVNFNDIKASFESIARVLGWECRMARGKHESFIEGRCAELFLGKKSIGFLGEIHPEVLNGFGIEEPVIAFEINLSEMGLWGTQSKD